MPPPSPPSRDFLCDPVAVAKALIRVPSVTPDQGPGLDVLQPMLEALGFACRRLPFGEGAERTDNLYAVRGEGAPSLCFAGHMDVVPPGDAAAWRAPPFAGEVVDGELVGRGAADMKGGIACFVAAVARQDAAASAAGAGQGQGRLSLLITGDEEGRALHGTRPAVEALVAEGERWDACLVGEPASAERLGDAIKVGRRGSVNMEVVVHGRQGHVAYPALADNPIHRLAAFLAEAASTPLDEGSERFQPSSLQVSWLEADNIAWNVVPPSARAVLNIRFNDLHDSASLEARLQAMLARHAPEAELVSHRSGESFLSEPASFAALVSAAVEERLSAAPALSTGGGISDARFFHPHAQVAELGLVGRTMHRLNEAVPLADLEALAEVYRAVLAKFFSAGAHGADEASGARSA